ncbi:transposase [Emticicia soli]|uniref:Transposase n=1 Tax=Emticicia soli TaxID=2027878 RepID=A0ABW5J4B2_9BACT
MQTLKYIFILLATSFLMFNCGGNKEETKAPETAEDIVQNITEEAEKLANEEPKDVVDPKLLQELLPADANGLPREKVSGEKTGAMGFQVATAEGKYFEGDNSIEVNIADVAGTGGIMGMAAWSMLNINTESETGYEKTTTYKDHKAFEKYDAQTKESEMAVLIASRFVVSIKGTNVDMSKIKATLDDIDLRKLADLK